MADDEDSKANAEAKENKSIFLNRVFWIWDDARVFVQEGCLRFLKRDAVFGAICAVLSLVLLERQTGHTYSITTT